jgi:hypothetical protein
MAKTKESKGSSKTLPDRSSWFEKLSTPRKDLVCVVILYALVLILFNKIVFSNMIFSDSGDTAAARSWAEAGKHLEESEHIEPQWFPYPFSGMPGFGSLAYTPRNVSYVQAAIVTVGRLLFLNGEMSWMVLYYFIAGVFMFFLCRYWKFAHLPSLAAAITFMLSPFAVGLAGGGHGSKLMAWSYLPLIFLLTHALFQRRDLLSLGLLSAALGTLFLTNHVQMVFYVLLVVGFSLVYELIFDLRSEPLVALKKTALLILALAIGWAISAYIYLSVYEYAQYSIRGGGELGTAGGLKYDYATNWSFHPFEIMNFLIPSFFGFRTPYYWGWMPFTESSLYIGITPIILGALALIYRRNRVTIFLAVLTAFIFILSFGKHLPILYDLFFNYMPFFNKFRAPSMILHLVPFTFGLLAAYGMAFLLEFQNPEREMNVAKLRKALSVLLIVLGTILLIGFLASDLVNDVLSGFMFEKEGEIEQLRAQYGQQAGLALDHLKKTRFDLFWNGKEIQGIGYIWNGYVRFALFSGGTIGLILLYLKRKMKSGFFSGAVIALLAIDLLIIDGDFIHPKPHTALNRQLQADETIAFLKSDTSLYRVYPVGELFQDNTYMFHFIQSLGGYSPAKLRIYQEMLDSCMFRGWDRAFPLNMNIVNMLNTKYLLSLGRLPEDKFTIVHVDQSKSLVTSLNPSFLPRAWFVDEIVTAGSKSEVFAVLNSPSFNPRHQAILEKTPSSLPLKSDTSSAQITSFGAHEITLETFSDKTALLVLSEVYYPNGWRAYIDGQETEIYKTNYILRSVIVPEGKHNVVFRYHSATYQRGLTISYVGWGISGALVIVGIVLSRRKTKGSFSIGAKSAPPAVS